MRLEILHVVVSSLLCRLLTASFLFGGELAAVVTSTLIALQFVPSVVGFFLGDGLNVAVSCLVAVLSTLVFGRLICSMFMVGC